MFLTFESDYCQKEKTGSLSNNFIHCDSMKYFSRQVRELVAFLIVILLLLLWLCNLVAISLVVTNRYIICNCDISWSSYFILLRVSTCVSLHVGVSSSQ